MFDKIWDSHVVHKISEKEFILYVDLHLIHEVTSPQAFDGIRLAKRTVRRPDLTLATTDHNTPTINRNEPLKDKIAELHLIEDDSTKIKDIYAGKNIDKISRFYRSFSIVNYLLFGVSNKN